MAVQTKKVAKKKVSKPIMGEIVKAFQNIFESISNSLAQGRLSIKEQTFLIKRLSFLITAGVPIVDSLHMIREQTLSKRQARVLNTVIDDVSNGQSLSGSLARFKNMFGEFAVNIIASGESAGILSENLEYLADELKKRQALNRKIIGACIYPIVVTCATLGITVFLMVYLFPKIMPVFNSLHMQLPLSTRMVIFGSNALQHHGFIIFAVLISLIIAFAVALKKSKGFHLQFDRLLLKVPVIGPVVTHYNMASSTRTLGLLLKSGITLSEAITVSVKTTKNLVYKKEFQNLSAVVDRGERLSVYLKTKKKIFPEVVPQIIAVGERSGSLANSLVYLSELYEGEVDDFTKNLSSVVEPALMVFMGLLVGFIAISIITPIYSITQNLHG